MLRYLPLIVLLATISLPAADFSGRWAGTIETGASRAPIYLTFMPYAGNIVGSVATGINAPSIRTEKLEVHDAELTFEIHDNANRLMRFRLTLSGGVLAGEASVGSEVSKIAVVSVGGGSGDRGVLGAGVTFSAGPHPAGGGGGGSRLGPGVYRVGGGVSAPVLIHKVEPEYTEEARQAKYQGTVLLYVEIGPDGTAGNIRVQRALGLGLDEKAIEAVKQWRFKPGQKDGIPVTVAATIEVNFRL